MKHAEIIVSAELFQRVLCFPADVKILVVVHDSQMNQWSFVLSGDGLPPGCETQEGIRPPQLTANFFKDNDAELISGVVWKVAQSVVNQDRF